ncbi:MAG: GGDEF domain-containing protein [Thermaerobacter sp.]|nr:GGDEF domain-containing protein [Thermaerobacter sp.]
MLAIAAVIAGWVVAGVIIETWRGLAVLTGVSGVFLLLTAGAVWLWRHIGRLEELTCTDELTGACNFRHLQRVLPREVAQAEREGRPLSLLMLDLRDFKGYNDRHGHVAGNQALAAVVRIIRSEVRTGDTVARCGGEEFAVVLPGAGEEEARRIGERVADPRNCCMLLTWPCTPARGTGEGVETGGACPWAGGDDFHVCWNSSVVSQQQV